MNRNSVDGNCSENYYPLGMVMPGRNCSSSYEFGFNDKMKDDDIRGNANSLDFGERIYDPRIGLWARVDELCNEYTSLSPYCFAGDNPISYLDIDG